MAAETRPARARASVRVRVTAIAVAVLAVVLALGAVALVLSLRATLTREARAAATLRAAEVARQPDPVAAVAGDDDVVLQVIGPDGRVVVATRGLAGAGPLADLTPGQSRVVDVPFDDDPFIAVATAAGDRTILLGQSLDTVAESTRTLATFLAVGLPLLLAVVGVTAWRLVGRALAPVDAMRAEVDAISAAEMHRRVSPPAGHDEIARLATTMNRMLDRVEEAHNRQRRFVADASHELRSPIAAIRQQAEVARAHPERGAALAEAAYAESLRMQALVEDLLFLARADERTLRLRRTAVDLDDLVLAEAVRARTTTARQVDTTAVHAVRVEGDQRALRRVLTNLVDNAVRHANGRVALSLAEEGGAAVVHVDDDGEGVPVAERDNVLERFVRLDDSRARQDGGTGLGLAIVAEIVRAHGGSVEIGDAPLGGARVTVRLPLGG